MRIQQLKLENFRGFEELTINFPDKGSVVFIGGNGAGKSSVLEAIVLACNAFWSKKIRALPEYVQLQQQDIKLGKEASAISLDLKFNGEEEKMKISIKQAGGNKLLSSVNEPEVEFIKSEGISSGEDSDFDSIPIFVYYPTNRSVKDFPNLDIPETEEFSARYAFKDAFTSTLDFSFFFRWFRGREDIENEKRLREDPDYRDQGLDAVRDAISSFSISGLAQPYIKRSPEEKFVLQKQNLEKSESLSIAQLSHGEKVLITTLGDLARRLTLSNPYQDNPLHGSGIVLIDEIELHLHPSWQRQIVPALEATFPNIQFIMTTHSPQVISEVKRENVFILEDFKLVEKTPHTLGRDSNTLLQDVFNVSERPKDVKSEFKKLYRIMDDPERVEEAKQLLKEMAERYGEDDPEIQRANMHYEFMNEA